MKGSSEADTGTDLEQVEDWLLLGVNGNGAMVYTASVTVCVITTGSGTVGNGCDPMKLISTVNLWDFCNQAYTPSLTQCTVGATVWLPCLGTVVELADRAPI